jgi:predicted ester cyclase
VSTPSLIKAFYERIWNAGDLAAVPELLAESFVFRGSLGNEMCGRQAFKDYVCSVRGSLTNYSCEVLDCVTEGNRAFAKMRFTGLHTGEFQGHQPTGKPVHWLGAAFFCVERGVITELWVLGDLAGLDHVLKNNQVLTNRKEPTPTAH